MPDPAIESLLRRWFGDSVADPAAIDVQHRLWFGAPGEPDAQRDARDELLRRDFGELAARAATGALDAEAATPQGRLGLILLLDQLPRNLHRGTARAFATDDRARALAEDGLRLGQDLALAPIERMFFYLPLEHAEDLEAQRRCVRLFERLRQSAPPGAERHFDGFVDYAGRHLRIIERFGRFPHRNAALGRESTPGERAWLAGTGSSFGQAPAERVES